MSHPSSGYVKKQAAGAPFTSTPDPYLLDGGQFRANVFSTSLPPHIDVSSLPGGLPILGPFFGFTNASRLYFINGRLAAFRNAVGRPLTVPEEQAVAWYSAKGFRTMSWGPAVGAAFGLGRWRSTMESMQLLGVGKLYDETVNQQWKAHYENAGQKPPWSLRWDNGKLWAGDRELLRTITNPVRKAAIVQGLRSLPYMSLGCFFSTIVTRVYANTVMALGESADSRLNDVGTRLKEKAQKAQGRQIDSATARSGRFESKNTEESTEFRANEVPSEAWQQQHREAGTRALGVGHDYDDASPTSGEEFFQDLGIEQRAAATASNDGKSKRQGKFQTSSQDNPFDIPERQGGFQQERYAKQVPSSETSFDDASPTGGAGSMDHEDHDPTGGAWGRIRENSMSRESSNHVGERALGSSGGYQQQKQRHQREKGQDGNLGYSRNEEERAYARIEAQKEFDAKLERERRGENFDGRKW